MSDQERSHPSSDELARFVSGLLDQDHSTVIETHLADCDTCRTVLEGLPDDSLVSILRAPAELPPAEAATVVPDAPQVPPELRDHPRYRALGLLGTGGMGAVYRAEHRLMERLVALKVINRELIDKPAAVDRFDREVKAAARLSHPNIVTAYDAERVGDMHFLVMEFVEGTNLADVVRAQGRLPVAQACDYVRQAALGLQHASQRGMVHRDIKPHNIVLTAEGQAKILDFGLARFLSESRPAGAITELGTVMGTPDYMAPEQARDARSADIRADLYSLGCTLYHLLAGHPPFPDGGTIEKLTGHLERLPRPLSEVRGDIPKELARVVERLMAKDPAQRYQTPAEVADALAPFCPGAASPVPVRPHRSRRGPRWLAAAVAVLLAGAGLLSAPTVIRVATGKGVLVIETDDPDVEVVVKQGGKEVRVLDLKTNRQLDLKAGAYQLELAGGPEGLKLSTDQFTLSRGGRQIVAVRLEPDGAARPASAPPLDGEVRRFDGHEAAVNCVALSRDGRHALSAAYDLTLRLWDVATGKELRRFQGYEELIWSVAFSPDGRFALSGGGGRWTDGRYTESVDHDPRLWEVATGKEVRRFRGHDGPVFGVAFSPDGAQALSAGVDGVMRLWDVATGKLVRRFEGHAGGVKCEAFSPDGRRALSTGLDRTVRVWDVASGGEVCRCEGHKARVCSAAFSPDGRQVLSGSLDKTVRLWDVATGRELRSLPHPTGVTEVAFTPDGRRALSASGARALDPEGSAYKGAGFDSRVRLWDLTTGKELQRFEGYAGPVWGLACSADGRYALTGSGDGTLRLWQLPEPAKPAPPAAPPLRDGGP
jgi:WD40 repeat protein